VSEEMQSVIVPIEEPVFSEEKGPDSEYKYRYRLNLNPGTTRHLLESTNPITIAHLPATSSGQPTLAIRVNGKTRVVHEEGDHATEYLPPKQYKVRALIEFDPWTGSELPVYD
jgi:hypothetical protein